MVVLTDEIRIPVLSGELMQLQVFIVQDVGERR